MRSHILGDDSVHPYAAINHVVERLRVKPRLVGPGSRLFHVDECIS